MLGGQAISTREPGGCHKIIETDRYPLRERKRVDVLEPIGSGHQIKEEEEDEVMEELRRRDSQ